MRLLLDQVLRRFIVTGRLTVYWPGGGQTTYQGSQGPEAAFRLHDSATVRRITIDPSLAVGEAYMDGTLEPVGCTIYEVLASFLGNLAAAPAETATVRWRTMLGRMTRLVTQFNSVGRSQSNVARHYDLNGKLYSLFLDEDWQYSCAYFPRGDETLEQAQAAKKRHIVSKLRLDRPGLSVLDIGSGWGGMALTLARDYGARVTGITLSREQLAASRERAEAAGLADRVTFELMDYRAIDRQYDRIVSVGMFEHVGVVHFDTFFATLRQALAPDGVALLHAIGRNSPPGATNPWIAKYIFPGGYCPPLSEVLPSIERSGLWVTDIEILRLHYATTLRHWRQRFAANRDAIANLYDERFCRMFEFYLCSAELSFRVGGLMIFQIQLAAEQEAVPLTRDYMFEAERAEPVRERMAAN
jgi:cyclopropane-fatty-acyl-phospholipid synthase